MPRNFLVDDEGRETKIKDTLAVLDYKLPLADWLDGDTLSGHTCVVQTPGLTKDSSAIVGDDIVFWLSLGIDGTDHLVRLEWDTAGGRHDGRTVVLRVKIR